MKTRALIVGIGITVLFSILLLRAAVVQVFPHSRLEALRERQFQTQIKLAARRGSIVDARGRDLAISTKVYSIYADPSRIKSPKKTARELAKFLDAKYETLLPRLSDKSRRFVWLQRQVSAQVSTQLKNQPLEGVALVPDYKRIYPNDSLASSVIGFVGREGQGLEGLELKLDEALTGVDKKLSLKRDARGRPLVIDGLVFSEEPEGLEARLTIDTDVQFMLEQQLSEAVAEFSAQRAYGVILDVETSAVVAMANVPGYDLNQGTKILSEARRNRPITDAFEPGSTLKTFVIADAIERGIFAPNSKINTEGGLFKIGKRVIKEAEADHKWNQLTVSEVLQFSSNIGTAKIGLKMGSETLRESLTKFGFGAKTGVDLPGEARGQVLKLPWADHLIANISFGHGMTATPLQIAAGYAAIANGGVLRAPYVVEQLRDPATAEVVEARKNQEGVRVINEETAQTMRLMLMNVTSKEGTGFKARVEGFQVAGKTGTAQKVNPNGRGYMPGAYLSSFAGFLPVNKPKYVIYVMLDEPGNKSFYGSQVAAPVFSRIASWMLRREGITPTLAGGLKVEESRNLASAPKEIKVKKVFSSQEVLESPIREIELMPNLIGLSMREVLQKLEGSRVEVVLQGTGKVVESWPASGDYLPTSNRVKVRLE